MWHNRRKPDRGGHDGSENVNCKAVKVIDDRGNELLVVKSLRDME